MRQFDQLSRRFFTSSRTKLSSKAAHLFVLQEFGHSGGAGVGARTAIYAAGSQRVDRTTKKD
jgi:hypothetical protein